MKMLNKLDLITVLFLVLIVWVSAATVMELRKSGTEPPCPRHESGHYTLKTPEDCRR